MKKIVSILILLCALIFVNRGDSYVWISSASSGGGGGGPTFPDVTDVSTLAYVKDEFIGGSTALFAGEIGEMGWFGNQSSSGGVLIPTLVVGDLGHPGVKQLSTGGGVGAYAFIHLPSTSAYNVLLIDEMFDIKWIVNLRQSDANTRAIIGMGSTALPGALEGIRVEKDLTDANWFAFTGDGATTTRASLGAVVAGDWEKFRIRRVDATTIGFTRNGLSEVQINTTLPTPGGQALHAYIENDAAADKQLDLDYFDMMITGLTR